MKILFKAKIRREISSSRLVMSLLCRDQFLKVYRVSFWISALVVVSWGGATVSVAQQLRLVPSISIMEQYDSNVFFAPKSQLTAGTKADDLITTFTPQLNLSQGNMLVKTNLSAGAVIQKFAHNSGLDNVGLFASTGVDLTEVVHRLLPRMTAFRLLGTYRYSPSTSAFGANGLGGGGFGGGGFGGLGGGFGGGGFGGFGSGGIGVAGPVDSGQITQRIRSSMYSVGFANSYALSPTTDFQTTYIYTQMSFGGSLTPVTSSSGQTGNTVFDTTAHSISAGPTARLSAADMLNVRYTYNHTSQAQFGNFATHNAALAWGRIWTRELSSTINGGAALIEPVPDSSVSGGQGRRPAALIPTGGFSVSYASGSSFLRKIGSEIKDATGSQGGVGLTGGGFLPVMSGMNIPGGIAASGSYRATLMYNLGVYPSFVQSAGPIYSHVVSLGGAAGITDRLTGQALLNFSHSSFTSQNIGTTFNSYGTTVMLNYLITPALTAMISHRWLMFDNQVNTAGVGDLSFSKHVVLIGFTYAYAPRGDFFRSGSFWESPSGGSSSTTGKSELGGGGDTKK
jgi:hypothetical protein